MKFNRRSPQAAGRQVGRLRLGTAAVAALGLGVLTACGGGSGTSDSAPESTTIKDLVVDVLSEPDSLDPFYRNTAETQRYYRLVYSSLLQWNEDGTLEPDLAAEMPEVSKDGLTWTVTLREGVTFHDGSPLTASDVVHTIEEAQDPQNGAVWLAGMSYVKSAAAQGDDTVVLTLSQPYAYLDGKLAMLPIISDEDDYKPNATYATTGNGSGPYALSSLKRGDSLVLERNEDYYGEPMKFETITFKVVPEDASRIARLTNGDSHIVPDLPTEQVDLVTERGANAVTVESNVSRLFAYPSMKADRPTSNADFRLAIAYAADRQRIVDQVYGGAGRPNSTYLTYGTLHHDEDLGLAFGAEPDLDKAKEHLAASGVKLDRKLSIIAVNDPQVTSAATILQSNLKDLGIESSVESQDVAGFYANLVSGEYDLILFDAPASTSTGFSPDYVNGGLNSQAANNFAKFADDEMDELLEVALTAQTKEEQAEAWRAVQQRDIETQGNIQLVVSQISQAWSKQLVGYEPSALLWLNTLRNVK
ncbi:ABC transporter substrate-binding protein [Nocardioides sp. zg-DK7169]|uniref:ABC transporter substrate-binding protein n=1 Tax=Nocardioides sp. zg-DK7169 TaxID=2736600 RepID=UPI0015555B00|nr:ABC transporter substrate-binding protein [Nocardioides sp. zg-DK7169]NPC97604.1 ABC transporter substrate-binding protein [Nocardioides sp. zg-DK7169]